MKKVLTKLSLLVIMLAMFIPEITKASHNTGGDISYTYISANTYLLRYRFYRDQTGINAPLQINLCYQSASLGLNGTALLLPIAGTGGLIPPSPCIPVGTGYLIEEYIYEGTVVVPAQAPDWIFSFSECCRNAGICNIQPNGLYVYATMDNLNFPTNSSPTFTSIPVTEFCVNNPFYWNQNAYDIDGDSLHYSVISALDGNGGCPNNSFPATYIAPATPTDPLPTLNGFNINPNTGIIYFTPTVQCTYVIAVLCEEFDPNTGVKKSELNRDMQIHVSTACNIIPPAFDSTFQLNGINIVVDGITSMCDDSIVYLILDPPVQCGSITTSDIRFVDANGVPNPVVAAVPYQSCLNGLTDTIQVTLLNPIQIGTSYLFTKIGFDGNTFLSECGSSMPEFDSIAITLVDSSSYLFNANDTVGCSFTNLVLNTNQNVDCYTITATGSEFTLVDANGLNIPIVSINCQGHYSNTFSFTVNPPAGVVGPLYLITQNGTDGNTFTNACGTAMTAGDTIATIIILNYIPVNAGPDQTVCSSLPSPSLNAGSFSPAATYSWTGPNGFTASTQFITASQTGQYIVTVTDGASCQGSDTVNITILNAPTVALGNDIFLCTGDPLPFLNAGNTGATYQWYYNGVALPNDTNQLLFPDSAGQYVVAVDLGGGCLGYDTINITINSTLVVNLGNSQTICSNDPLPILDAGISGATYVWTGPGVTAADTLQTLALSQAGTYSVVVTNPTGCSGTGSYTLTIVQAPSVNLGLDQTYCAGDPVTPLDAQNTGGSYVWSGPGTTAADTLQTYTPTQTGTFSVVVNNGGICTATSSVNITIVTSLSVSVNNPAYCQGSAVPALQATTSNSGVHYGWSGPGTTAADTLAAYSPQGPGTYTVTISIGTCVSSATATVTEVPTPTPSLASLAACQGDNIQDLDCGYAPIAGTTYNWTGTGTSNGQTFTPTLVTGANNFSVTVTNTASGVSCSSQAVNMVYTLNPTPVVSLTPDVKCSSPNSTTTLDAGNAGAAYQWSLNGTAIQNATSQTYAVGSSVTESGTYSVVVTSNGCPGTGSTTVTINANPTPAIKDAEGETEEVFFCDNPPYPILSSGVENAATWAWTLDGTSTGTSNTNLTVEEPGTYGVLVTDANGCTGTAEIKVSLETCDIIVYNVFTPNSDGSNQYFVFGNLLDFKVRKLTVYDRWGKEIYSNDNYDNMWDGGDATAGTYYWVLEYANETISKNTHGIVNIIK